MRLTDFKVTGSGQFPYDMLRYDLCWPTSRADALKLEGTIRESRTVTLTTCQRSITPDRWRSFQWTVEQS